MSLKYIARMHYHRWPRRFYYVGSLLIFVTCPIEIFWWLLVVIFVVTAVASYVEVSRPVPGEPAEETPPTD